jgi:glutamate receptor, ionotropic, invertebrate
MEAARPTVFTSNNNEGVERVKKAKGTYAFLMESTSIEYTVERFCDLQQVGGLLDSKGWQIQKPINQFFIYSLSFAGYGIAMRQGSPYRTLISGAVLKLQEDGRLHVLKTRWWKEKRGGGSCRVNNLTG